MKQSLKKIAYFLITAALIFTALSVVRYGDGEGPREVQAWNADALASVETAGCDLRVTENGVLVTPNADGAYFVLPINGQAYNLVSIGLAEPLTEGVETYIHDHPTETATGKSYRADEGKTLYFNMPTQEGDEAICVDVLVPMTLQSVTTLCISGTPVPLVFNLRATIVLAAALLVLVLLEKRFGYFEWIRQTVCREIARIRALWYEKKPVRAVLYAVAELVTLAFLLTVGVFILFGIYTKASIYTVFALGLVALVLQLVRLCFLSDGVAPAKLFLAVAILAGMVLVYAMPPVIYVSWDDQIHYWRAYEVPHLLDSDISIAETRLYVHRLFSIDTYADDPEAFVYTIVQGDSIDVEHDPYMHDPYISLGYLPMSFSIGVLSLADADMVTLMVLCRLANLLTYAFIVYSGIRKLKSGAYIFSAVCLLPTALFLASTCNYDFWLTAWVAYGLCTVLSVLQTPDRKFTASELAHILIAFFLACGPKAIYFFMLTPLLFLPKERFASPLHVKRFRRWTLITMGVIVLFLLIPMLVLPGGYTDVRGGAGVDSMGQIKFILSNPFRYAGILFQFLGEYVSLVSLNHGSCFFAYLGGPHAFFGTVAGFLLLYCAFTDRREGDCYEGMTRTRVMGLLTCLGQVVLVATSLYVGFTPVGLGTINGCQFRYLFPIFLPFFFFLVPKGIKCKINERFQGMFVFTGLGLNVLLTLCTIYLCTF